MSESMKHYGSHGVAECGAHGDGRLSNALLTKDPALVTCPTCRGWLPIVCWPDATRGAKTMSEKTHPIPSWRQRTVIAILLLVARWCAEDEASKAEIQHIANHISGGHDWGWE